MNVLIVEDEILLAKQFAGLLYKLEPHAIILGQTNSIETSVAWLQSHPAPDLIFMDIELADGKCFEIFEQVQVKSPVVFTTAYDEYALKAFKVNSIDYLLKPIREKELATALAKWKELRLPGSTTGAYTDFTSLFQEFKLVQQGSPYRDRFLVKQGQKMLSVSLDEIAYFTARNTLNFIVTRSKQKYMIDYPLDEIEPLVPPRQFFRANRQYIVAHDIITAIHGWFNGKLKLELAVPVEEEIVVSREKAPLFKTWMGA
jgi:DNA-binding LytR/AlgR family response regulator